MIETRIAEREDAELIQKWYQARGFQKPSPSLPPLGVVAFRFGEPVAVIYAAQLLGTAVAMLDWMVTAPALSPKTARLAISSVLERIEFELRNRGVESMMVQFSDERLAAEAMELGFRVVALNVINMTKQL